MEVWFRFRWFSFAKWVICSFHVMIFAGCNPLCILILSEPEITTRFFQSDQHTIIQVSDFWNWILGRFNIQIRVWFGVFWGLEVAKDDLVCLHMLGFWRCFKIFLGIFRCVWCERRCQEKSCCTDFSRRPRKYGKNVYPLMGEVNCFNTKPFGIPPGSLT